MTTKPGIEGVVQREREALVVETRLSQVLPFVAVNDIEVVASKPGVLRSDHPARITELSGSKGEAYVVDCPSLNSTALWVGTYNDHYRADYLLYIQSVLKVGVSEITKAFHVDHLYNVERASNYGLKYLRIALVGGRENMSHGSAVEKPLTANEALREAKDRKIMDELISMKYFGFLPPVRNDPRENEIAAYAQFASAMWGFNPQETRQRILYLKQKALTPSWPREGR